jgi:hypothetical protein
VKLTTHLHIVPRSRIIVAIPPFLQYAFWHGSQLKHRDNFTFTWNAKTASGDTTHCHEKYTRVYSKVSGLAAWSENCKWYSSLPLGAVISLFCESVWWVLSSTFVLLLNMCLLLLFHYPLSLETFGYIRVYINCKTHLGTAVLCAFKGRSTPCPSRDLLGCDAV